MNIAKLAQEAEAGSCVAQSILGTCYLDGIDVEIDFEKAFDLLSAASAQGASRAACNLARMYADGLGIPKNPSMAIRLYEKAAEAGDLFSQVELGRIFSRGADLPADPDSALRWYQIAAAQEGVDADCEEFEEAKRYVVNAAKRKED